MCLPRDLWIGELVTFQEASIARHIITELAASRAPKSQQGLESVIYAQSLRIVRQGYERALFQAHFEAHPKLGYMHKAQVSLKKLHVFSLDLNFAVNTCIINLFHSFDSIR